MFVKLREDWQAKRFQRRIRDEKGNVVLDENKVERVIHFPPGVPVEIPDDDEDAKRTVAADIEKGALIEVVPVRRGWVQAGEIQAGEISDEPPPRRSPPTSPADGGGDKPKPTTKGDDLVGPDADDFGQGQAAGRKKR